MVITRTEVSDTSSERSKSVFQALATPNRTSQIYGSRAGISWVPLPRSAVKTDRCLHQAEVGTQWLQGTLKDHRDNGNPSHILQKPAFFPES